MFRRPHADIYYGEHKLRDFSFWSHFRRSRIRRLHILFLVLLSMAGASSAAGIAGQPSQQPRARDLGVPFDGTPGPLNKKDLDK